jgi:hypothetical protein
MLQLLQFDSMKKTILFAVILLTGTYVVNGQVSKSIEGIWLGTLKIQATELRLGITISAADDGTYRGVLNSIDQGGVEVPLDETRLTGDTLEVKSAMLGLNMKGAVYPEKGTWETVFQQGTYVSPLTMKRVDRLPDVKQ